MHLFQVVNVLFAGWFDPWSFLFALRAKNIDLGVDYIHGDVINMAHDINRDKNYGDNIEDEMEDEMKRMNNLVKVRFTAVATMSLCSSKENIKNTLRFGTYLGSNSGGSHSLA